MRPIALIAAAAMAALALGACGKRGELRAPDDAAAAYTFPKFYPKPASVAPTASQAETENREDPQVRRSNNEIPSSAGRLSVTPNSRRTKTYGTPPP